MKLKIPTPSTIAEPQTSTSARIAYDEYHINANSIQALSIKEDDDFLYVEALLPGIEGKNIMVAFDQKEKILLIEGKRTVTESEQVKYFCKIPENFYYRITVPELVVKTPTTYAVSTNGLLLVKLTKLPRSQL